MVRQLSSPELECTIHPQEGVTIERNGTTFETNPGEIEHLIDMIVIAMRVESFPVLPAQLLNGTFECKFTKNRTLEFKRQDSLHTALACTFAEADKIIVTLKQCVAIFKELQQFDPSDRVGFSRNRVTETPF